MSGPPVAWTSCVRTYCGSDLLWLGPTVSGPTVASTYCVRTSCGADLLWPKFAGVTATGGPREALP